MNKLNHLIVLVLLLVLFKENDVSFYDSFHNLLIKFGFLLYSVLNLQQKMGQQQFISVEHPNDYSLIYKPSPDIPPTDIGLIIDISKATRRISLEEKFRLERRSNHYICKKSK